MKLMSPTDSMFLLTESREHPMHVVGLQLFEPPEDAGPEFVREIYEAMADCRDFQRTFRKHPASSFGGIANFGWSFDSDDDIDLDYHLRRSALPSPRRVRDLLELTSRLHGTLLDRHRPLWERALAITETAYGPEHPIVGRRSRSCGTLRSVQPSLLSLIVPLSR